MSTYTPNGDDNERQCCDDNIPVLNLEDLEDFSSGKSSETPHSALTTKRHRSEVWDHFTKKENNGILRAYCNYCSKHFAFKSSQGTSTLHAHLGRCSQYKCKHPENLKQKTLPSIIDSKGTSSGTLASRFDQDVCKRRLARMFIVAELPFKFVEHEELRGFLEALQPKFSLPSRRTLTRECLELFREERGKLKRYFSSYAPRVCLTTDTWTSNQNLNYMCLTCHFIDEEWNLHKRILNFCQVTGHSGEIIGKTVEKCLVSWGLTKILTITVDNASANDVGIQYLKKRFQSWNTLIMKGEFLHMRCCAHILSLTVKEGLKDIDDSIFRIRSAVRYVRLSPARTARFKNCAEEEGIETKSLLCLDVETRWNSTYLMLETAIKFQKAFALLDIQDEKFGHEHRKEKMKGVPTEEDWEHARNILPFLKYFYDATMNISGSLYVTCNNFVNEILGVGFEIKQRCESDDMSIRMMAERMKRKHDKYWSNISNMNVLLFVASVLDPRQKLYFVEWMINNVYEADIANQLSGRIRYTLYGMFAHYESVIGPKRKKYNQSSESTSVKGKEVKAKSHMAVFNQEVGQDCLAEKSELDRYLGEEREAFVEGEAFNVLDWWKKCAARYPVLALMANDILAIPISTVASESAFSTGGRVLDVFRSSLTPTMVEALVCGQDWLRASTTLKNYEEDFQELEDIEKEEGFANTAVAVDPSLAALSIDD